MTRSRLLLAGLGAIGVANGFFLAFGLYGLLAAVLHLLGVTPPPLWLGIVAGLLSGAAVTGAAVRRARFGAGPGLGRWRADPPGVDEAAWAQAAAEIAAKTELREAPRVGFMVGSAPNSLVVEPSGRDAQILLTEGLVEKLSPSQRQAVLAHEIAHLEAGDVRAACLADAICQTVDDLSEAKGRILWGPKEIALALLPVTAVGLVGGILVPLLPEGEGNEVHLGQLLVGLGLGILVLAWLVALVRTAIASWQGFLQLFVYLTFFGPLTLVEAALAWPTMFALARLFSRTRVYAADARALELTSDPDSLIGALEAVQWVERSPADRRLEGLRFGLFATPRAQSRYLALIERVTGTHPSAARRIARIRERAAQERWREAGSDSAPVDSLEQSG